MSRRVHDVRRISTNRAALLPCIDVSRYTRTVWENGRARIISPIWKADANRVLGMESCVEPVCAHLFAGTLVVVGLIDVAHRAGWNTTHKATGKRGVEGCKVCIGWPASVTRGLRNGRISMKQPVDTAYSVFGVSTYTFAFFRRCGSGNTK